MFAVRYKELFTLYKLCPSAMPNFENLSIASLLQVFVPEQLFVVPDTTSLQDAIFNTQR